MTTHDAAKSSLPRVSLLAWVALGFLLAFTFALELAIGSVAIPLKSVVRILLGMPVSSDTARQIVLMFRLPRAVTAMLAGAALGVAGLKMQTLFRNPLADPFVLGISSGAGLGVAIVVLAANALGLSALMAQSNITGSASIILAATIGALVVLGAVLMVARRVESTLTILIVGLMAGYISGSLVSIMMQFAIEHQMQSYITWTYGSFGGVTWTQMTVFAPVVVAGVLIGWLLAKSLNALLLGDGYAHSMGVNVSRVRAAIIAGASLLAGAVTAFCGPIGFLGIAVPHLCRMLLKTSDHRVLIPSVVLLGGSIAMLADLISQAPGTQMTLPLNAITALIGAPVVVGVVLKSRHVMEAG